MNAKERQALRLMIDQAKRERLRRVGGYRIVEQAEVEISQPRLQAQPTPAPQRHWSLIDQAVAAAGRKS